MECRLENSQDDLVAGRQVYILLEFFALALAACRGAMLTKNRRFPEKVRSLGLLSRIPRLGGTGGPGARGVEDQHLRRWDRSPSGTVRLGNEDRGWGMFDLRTGRHVSKSLDVKLAQMTLSHNLCQLYPCTMIFYDLYDIFLYDFL